MADKYVSPTGNDNTGDGDSAETAYFSIPYALTQIGDGDEVIVGDGDYTYSVGEPKMNGTYDYAYIILDGGTWSGNNETKYIRCEGTANIYLNDNTYTFRNTASETGCVIEFVGDGDLTIDNAGNGYICYGTSGGLVLKPNASVTFDTYRGFLCGNAYNGIDATGATFITGNNFFSAINADLSAQTYAFDGCTLTVTGQMFNFTGASGDLVVTMDDCTLTNTGQELITPVNGAALKLHCNGGIWSIHSFLPNRSASATAFVLKLSCQNFTQLTCVAGNDVCELDGNYAGGYVVFKDCTGISGRAFIVTGYGAGVATDCKGIESIVADGCTGTFTVNGIIADRQFTFGRFDNNHITTNNSSGSHLTLAVGPEGAAVTPSGAGDGIGYFSMCNNRVTCSNEAGHGFFVGPGATAGHVVGNRIYPTDNVNAGIGIKHTDSVIVTGNVIHTDGWKAFTIKGSTGTHIFGNTFVTEKTTAGRVAVIQITGDADSFERPERNIIRNNVVVGIGNTVCVEVVNTVDASTSNDHANNIVDNNCYWGVASGGYTPYIGHLLYDDTTHWQSTLAELQEAWTLYDGEVDPDDLAHSNDANSIYEDPHFFDLDGNDYRVRSISPCIQSASDDMLIGAGVKSTGGYPAWV